MVNAVDAGMPPPIPAPTSVTPATAPAPPTSGSNVPAKPVHFVETYVGGFLFNSLDQIRHLLIDYYGVPASAVDEMGPLDMSSIYYNEHIAFDSPDFIHVPYRFPDSPDVDREGWLLPCRLAFVLLGRTPPKLDFDHHVEAYAEKWFPKALRETEPFKGIRYIMIPYPKEPYRTHHTLLEDWTSGSDNKLLLASPFLRRKLNEHTQEGCDRAILRLVKWAQKEEEAGRVVNDSDIWNGAYHSEFDREVFVTHYNSHRGSGPIQRA
ncbi:uncharacterized protein BXZ73DRAFT_78356 [Epithele typhae]|uniref:uncharacterized protein n=1 Tax=Epithele typhae TaxID=378194 RepID=UPI002008A407|nr:uncharacterized protein BXZ73DRAFT_78356 [Epithele typhae]KAH9928559.1 hypothetical protein BXZ73DRAFT_78356 [Epithele typhae]